MDRKMSTSTEQLCKGYATEFRSYFEYCRSLRFEDRPDYAYLKRLFKELFYRKGFQYDNMFDWTVLNLQQERSRIPSDRPLGSAGADQPPAQQPDREDEENFRRPASDANRLGEHYGGGTRDQSQRSGSRGYGGRGGAAPQASASPQVIQAGAGYAENRSQQNASGNESLHGEEKPAGYGSRSTGQQ